MMNGANTNAGRRSFVKRLALLFLVSPFWEACQQAARLIKWRLLGANFSLGHRLLTQDFPSPTQTQHTKLLIIGGGVTGLSAARQLKLNGESDFKLLELEQQVGGNAASGQNEYSAYPLGAHYLPLPNTHDKELMAFLESTGIITHYNAKGEPVFDETQLVMAPQERLFINHFWQEGLVPNNGLSEDSKAQIKRFHTRMDELGKAKGTDGKYLFDIPIAASSSDTSLQHWDKITMQEWLSQEGFTASELFDYVDYCCTDDFGIGINQVSAWAGVHYFTARKDTHNNDLTWPEGNARLVKHLAKDLESHVLSQQLAYKIKLTPYAVEVLVYDAVKDISTTWTADKVILATPQFINQRLLPQRQLDLAQFHYAPWIVATLTLSSAPQSSHMGLCWDNVIFRAQGLGYINVMQQSIAQFHDKCVITYYRAFPDADALKARRQVYQTRDKDWEAQIIADLKIAHPEIERLVESIELQRWGHGMISPKTGFIFGQERLKAQAPIDNRLFFAHTDLTGMSLFEEAFHQGIAVANKVLQH